MQKSYNDRNSEQGYSNSVSSKKAEERINLFKRDIEIY